jgi:hypothetical protein
VQAEVHSCMASKIALCGMTAMHAAAGAESGNAVTLRVHLSLRDTSVCSPGMDPGHGQGVSGNVHKRRVRRVGAPSDGCAMTMK